MKVSVDFLKFWLIFESLVDFLKVRFIFYRSGLFFEDQVYFEGQVDFSKVRLNFWKSGFWRSVWFFEGQVDFLKVDLIFWRNQPNLQKINPDLQKSILTFKKSTWPSKSTCPSKNQTGLQKINLTFKKSTSFIVSTGVPVLILLSITISILLLACPVMANEIRTGDPRGFNKGRSSKFRVGSRDRQTHEKGRWTYRPKRCGNNNKYEDNSPQTLNDKNHQASSQKFREWNPNF